MSDSIQENILFGLDVEGMSEDELTTMLDEAARFASAFDFIHDSKLFPQGYRTPVGERGVKLSGG